LVLAFVAIAYAVTPVVEGLMRQWHMRDLDIRATLVAASLQEALRETPGEDESGRLSSRLTNLIRDERPLRHRDLPHERHAARGERGLSGTDPVRAREPAGPLERREHAAGTAPRRRARPDARTDRRSVRSSSSTT
jgi:hypothetical protein